MCIHAYYQPLTYSYLILRHMEPLFRIITSGNTRNKIKSRQASLTTRRDKYQNRFGRRVCLDGNIGWFIHGSHSGTVVFPWKPVNVNLQLHRPHRWMEVEESLLLYPKPVCQVLGVSEGSRETYHSYLCMYKIQAYNITIEISKEES